MMKIPLTQSKFALVDDEDYEWLSQWKWCPHKNGHATYAHRNLKIGDHWGVILMHREIMKLQPGDGIIIDHIDRNSLNNQKSNLRVSNKSQNAINSRLNCNNSSGYRGVFLDRRDGKWYSQIRVNYKKIHGGRFEDKVSAALSYDKLAIKHYGKDAFLNFK